MYKTRIGDFDIGEKDTLFFVKGLPGFENYKKYSIVTVDSSAPFKWLISLENSEIALPVINPWMVRIDYDISVPDADLKVLSIKGPEDSVVWAVSSIPENAPEHSTVDLVAPIIVNIKNNKAMQIILDDNRYTFRHSIKEELLRSEKLLKEVK